MSKKSKRKQKPHVRVSVGTDETRGNEVDNPDHGRREPEGSLRGGPGHRLIRGVLHRSTFLLFFSCFIPAVVLRIYAIGQLVEFENVPLSLLLCIARGFVSDGLVAVLFCFVLRPILPVNAVSLGGSLVLWCLIYTANHEHVIYNASNIGLAFAKYGFTNAFIWGNILVASLWIKFFVSLTVAAVVGIAVHRLVNKIGDDVWKLFCPFCLVFLAILVPLNAQHPRWLQVNIIEYNVFYLLDRLAGSSDEHPGIEFDKRVFDKYFSSNLDGTPRVTFPDFKPNILILIIEGLGVSHISQDITPYLKSLAETNLFYNNVIGLQRQTNRGLYALLCGDYPNLKKKESKADFLGESGTAGNFLPRILRDAGYSTLFIQAADLGFMNKDVFAKQVGFQTILGNAHFQEDLKKSTWGVNDQILLDGAWDEIQKLEATQQPWMTTILTAGSHPPFNVPKTFLPDNKKDADLIDAFRFADHALSGFIDKLKKHKLLEKTLIVVCSDEVGGAAQNISDHVYRHMSYATVLTPFRESAVISELFTQADLAISIADYLGLGNQVSFGRSMFRAYSRGRSILFGDAHTDCVYSMDETGRVLLCDSAFTDCNFFRRTLAGKELDFTKADTAAVDELRQVVAYNDRGSESLKSTLLYEEQDRWFKQSGNIIGDFKVAAQKGDRLNWKVKLRAETNAKIAIRMVVLRSSIRNSALDYIVDRRFELKDNQVLDLNRSLPITRDEPCISTTVVFKGQKGDRLYVENLQIRKEIAGRRHSLSPDYERILTHK